MIWFVHPEWDVGRNIELWVGEQIYGEPREFGQCQTLAVFENDTLIAGVVYHNWEPRALVIELSAASTTRRWLTKPVLYRMFQYPFEEMGAQLCVLRVSEHHPTMNKILPRYGFTGYRIPRLRGRDEAEIVYTLTVEDWKKNGFH